MNIDNVDICCGLAWGDEAKGKIVTELIRKKSYDWVCRWSGGSNAGHTIYISGIKYTTHIIPAGIFFGIPCYIGPDCYFNIDDFIEEIEYLESHNFDTKLIFLSPRLHIITSEHKEEDLLKYKNQQGSTGKGIAPCAGTKFRRQGILLKDCKNTKLERFRKNIWTEPNNIINPLYGRVLCEGAQGFWLDVNYGNYPYVTSSNTLPYSACSLGFPPQKIKDIYGAVKIYDTRVGRDPDFDNLPECPILDKIAEVGQEYGSTTNRKRKVNWLNMNKLIQAINISGTTHIIISKVDILEEVKQFKLIVNGSILNYYTMKNLKSAINKKLLEKCPLIQKIIYSDNPETIQEL
jgi:adenylosuccinate synthase